MILVTGGSGYLGSHIVRGLAGIGHRVRVLVYNRARAEREGRLESLDVDWVEGDVTRPETLAPALQDVKAVIHTVAIAIEKGGRTYEEINYQGTVNLVEETRSAGIERFINVSQLGADPLLPYRFLASKGKAQSFVAGSGLAWTAFYPSAIWGPEDEFANTFARLVPLSPIVYPIPGDGRAAFQPVWVDDVASCCVQALDEPETVGKEYELGGPEVLTLEEIERRTLQAVGARRMMIHVPMRVMRVLVGLMETLLPAPPVTRSLLELLSVRNVTTDNAINKFVPDPRPFIPENTAPYMRGFHLGDTLSGFFGRK